MTDRKRWKQFELIVRQIIHEWDPCGLLANGCPADEYDQQILLVVSQAGALHSPNDAANALSRIFSQTYGLDGFAPDDCREVGVELHTALVAA